MRLRTHDIGLRISGSFPQNVYTQLKSELNIKVNLDQCTLLKKINSNKHLASWRYGAITVGEGKISTIGGQDNISNRSELM